MKKRGVSSKKNPFETKEVKPKKFFRPLNIGIFILIFIGIILTIIFNDDTSDLQPKEYTQTKIGKNTCFLDTLALRYGTDEVFSCDTDEDCIKSLKEYHKATLIPEPSQSVMDRVKCLS